MHVHTSVYSKDSCCNQFSSFWPSEMFACTIAGAAGWKEVTSWIRDRLRHDCSAPSPWLEAVLPGRCHLATRLISFPSFSYLFISFHIFSYLFISFHIFSYLFILFGFWAVQQDYSVCISVPVAVCPLLWFCQALEAARSVRALHALFHQAMAPESSVPVSGGPLGDPDLAGTLKIFQVRDAHSAEILRISGKIFDAAVELFPKAMERRRVWPMAKAWLPYWIILICIRLESTWLR